MDKYVAILGSDSEEEMSTKPDYIDALKMVHQLDGLNSLVIPKNYFFKFLGTIILSQPDLPRYAPNYNQLNATNHGGFIKLKVKSCKSLIIFKSYVLESIRCNNKDNTKYVCFRVQ